MSHRASAPDVVPCPACRAHNLSDARFCSQCGVPLGDAAPPPSARSMDVDFRDRASELPVGPDPLVGAVIAERYRILEQLGRGGMGVVYKVEHARIGKLMALKLLAGELGRDANLVARFKREALMVSKLNHPNTVQVFDYGVADGLTYLAMEYLRGSDLMRIVRSEGPLSAARTSKILIQACSSLAEAHAHGIVHRDLKPENLIILRGQAGDDVVKVLDFGLAKLRESSELNEVTTRGSIVGTPYYMSPEQIRGESVDGRTDIYALGAVMHVCLTGRPVFDAPTPMGVLTRHLTDDAVPPSQRFPELGVSPSLSAIIMRCIEKSPDRRYQSVDELQRALVDELRGLGQSSVDVLLDSGAMRRMTAPAGGEAATRDEVEAYERKLRRGALVSTVFVVLAVLALAAFGIKRWRASSTRTFSGVETEPNDAPSQAEPLPWGSTVSGQIGRRVSADTSDRDFYALDVPAGVERASVTTTGLPNMALCTALYRAGLDAPIGRWCSGRVGRGLDLRRLALQPGRYFVAVMQDRDQNGDVVPPVYENISDDYRLTVVTAADDEGYELEPNDDARGGAVVAPGTTVRGRFAWTRDVDVVCARGGGPRTFVINDAENAPRSRGALQVTERSGKISRVFRGGAPQPAQAGDVATPFSTTPAEATLDHDLCVVLSAVEIGARGGAAPGASDAEWSVRVEAR